MGLTSGLSAEAPSGTSGFGPGAVPSTSSAGRSVTRNTRSCGGLPAEAGGAIGAERRPVDLTVIGYRRTPVVTRIPRQRDAHAAVDGDDARQDRRHIDDR